jgi:hypothetical protein
LQVWGAVQLLLSRQPTLQIPAAVSQYCMGLVGHWVLAEQGMVLPAPHVPSVRHWSLGATQVTPPLRQVGSWQYPALVLQWRKAVAAQAVLEVQEAERWHSRVPVLHASRVASQSACRWQTGTGAHRAGLSKRSQ